MKVRSIHVENYRSLRDVKVEDIPQLSIFIGQNDAGKSAILSALGCFRTSIRGGVWPTAADVSAYGNTNKVGVSLIVEIETAEVELALEATTVQFRSSPEARTRMREVLATLPNPLQFNVWFDVGLPGFPDQVGTGHSVSLADGRALAAWLLQRYRARSEIEKTQTTEGIVNEVTNLTNLVPEALIQLVADRIHILGPTRDPADQSPPLPALNFGPDARDLGQALYYHVGHNTPEYQALEKSIREIFPQVRRVLVPPVFRQGENVQLVQVGVTERGIGRMIPARAMSSGMKEALATLARLALAPGGSLVTIEEPEIHFHPAAIKVFMRLVREASATKQIVLVTHSTQIYEDPELEMNQFWMIMRPGFRETVATRCSDESDIDKISVLMWKKEDFPD